MSVCVKERERVCVLECKRKCVFVKGRERKSDKEKGVRDRKLCVCVKEKQSSYPILIHRLW